MSPCQACLRGKLYENVKKQRGGDGSNQHEQWDQNDPIAQGRTAEKLAKEKRERGGGDRRSEDAKNQNGQNDHFDKEKTAENLAKEKGVGSATIMREAVRTKESLSAALRTGLHTAAEHLERLSE